MDRKDIEKRVRLWEAEGYDVSELKAKWFSTRRGNGPKRLLIALVVVAVLVTVLVSTRPQASFYASPTDGDAPLTVQFYDRSAGIVTSRAWDFGDGSTSRTENPSHTYTSEGIYTVRLTVTGLIGSDTGTQSRHIAVVERPSYDLIISSSAGGSVTTPDEGTFSHDAGTVVNLVAIPGDGYQFKNWTGNVGTISNVNSASTTITMNGNCAITANFEPISPALYTVTIAVSPAGSGTTVPSVGSHTYDAGTRVTLTAVPASGYQFLNWIGDVDTIVNVNHASTTITMNDDYSITASFTRTTTAPPIPHAFYGSLLVNGLPAPVGTEVEARGEGVLTGTDVNPITVTIEGEYGSPDPLTKKLIVQGDIAPGTEIKFYVNGHKADQIALYKSGDITELDLTVEISAVTFSLMVFSTAGGSVTALGDDALIYDDVNAAETAITTYGHYSIIFHFAAEVQQTRDRHDLDAIRDNLSGSHVPMNHLDAYTTGCDESARPVANDDQGWERV